MEIENVKEQNDKSTNLVTFYRYLKNFNDFMDCTFSIPMTILQNVVGNIQSFVANHSVSVGICLCTTITATISATSIAVGVGVGLGVGCQQTNTIYTNSTNR